MNRSGLMEPEILRRSQQNLYECTSPTSWEFYHQHVPAFGSSPSSFSAVTSIHAPSISVSEETENRVEECSAQGRTGRRISSGSNRASQRSHDSGFSDNGRAVTTDLPRQTNSSPSLLAPRPEISAVECSYNLACTRKSVQNSPGPDMVGSFRRSVCSECIYEEVILAQSEEGSPLLNGNMNMLSMLGAPACCSTPKQHQQQEVKKKSRLNLMEKIDNFESLNKNVHLDSNNNSSNSDKSFFEGKLLKKSTSAAIVTALKRSSVSKISLPPGTDSNGNNNSEHENKKKSNNSGRNDKNLISEIVPAVSTNTSSPYQSLPKGFIKKKKSSYPSGETARAEKGGAVDAKIIENKVDKGEVVVVRSQADNDALRFWLHELRSVAEPECLHTLQMKGIPRDRLSNRSSHSFCNSTRPQRSTEKHEAGLDMTATFAIHSVSASLNSVRNVERMASIISGEFSKICKHLEFGLFAPVPTLVESLVDTLDSFLQMIRDLGPGDEDSKAIKLQNWLIKSCYELRKAGEALETHMSSSSTGRPTNLGGPLNADCIGDENEREFHSIVGEIVESVVSLGNLFGQVVDQRLRRDLMRILEVIEGGELLAGVGLKSFMTMLNEGGSKHICRLAASIRTVRVLLGALLDASNDNEKVLALRCLSSILCAGEAVTDFDQAGGFEIVTDIICDSRFPMVVKFEAVSVLTQATDPWIDLDGSLSNLSCELVKIIICLTYMFPQCQYYEDGFLLLVATLSNLTFLESSAIELFRRHRTIAKILSAVKSKPDFSIFVLDHVSTILANAAGSERCRKEIIRCGGVVTLLCFMQQRPSPFESAAEIAACERLQQRSTVAISRLCVEDGVPQMVLEMGGMQRMIQLCRQERDRNYSDGVLIASLATLRKLAPFCSDEYLREANAEDLIRPKLLDSFLMFSSRQESYV